MTSDLTWLLSWYFRWKYPLNNCSVSLNRSPPACNTRQTVSSSVLLGPGFVFRTPGCPAFAQLFLLRPSPRYCESTVAFFGSVILCSLAAQVHVLFPLPCWIFFFFFFFAPTQKTCAITELKKCLHTKAGAGESLKFDGSFQIFSPSLQTAAALCSLCVRFTVPNHTLSLQNAAQSSLQSGKSC